MKFISALCLIAISLAACETVPASMDPAAFDAETARLNAASSIVAVDTDLGSLLTRADLTPSQRADALFLRAEKRLSASYNLPGAVEDFDAFIALVPEDPRIGQANRRKVFAATEIENAERRLAGLQNLPDWFDDKILMGDLASAVERYQTSGLTPTDFHLFLLRESGFICAAEGQTLHRYGPKPDYLGDAIWCPDPGLS
jgi:hypothetical protein